MTASPNYRAALDAGRALCLHLSHHRSGASERGRSPAMRAQRAKVKFCKDVIIIATQGKRGTSDALGCGPKMISSFFRSGLTRLWRVKPERKKEVGWGGALPRAAASPASIELRRGKAALPRAVILLPLRDAGRANQRAGGDGEIPLLPRIRRPWPAAPFHEH